MADLPLTLKYRPRRLSEIAGQPAARAVLTRMLASGEIRPALLFTGAFGSGKAQPLDASVLTPTGFRRMGDLKVGDPVIDPEGQSSEVTGVFPQGVRDIYRVTFSDGSSCECTSDHLWPVQRPKLLGSRASRAYRTQWGLPETGNRQHVLVSEVRELASFPSSALRRGGGQSWTLAAEVVPSVDLEEENLPLDPYTLGLLLGDGHLPERDAVLFGSEDPELREACRAGVEPLGVTLVATDINRVNASKWFRLTGTWSEVTECRVIADTHSSGALKRGLCNRHYLQETHVGRLDQWALVGQAKNPVRLLLREMELLGTDAESKFVPVSYRVASAKTRLAVLQGLLDTDGSAVPGGAEFGSASVQLVRDVQWLARSLGFRATEVRSHEHHYWNVQHQEWREARDRNHVSVYRSPEMPELFRLGRKRRAAARSAGRWGVAARRFVSAEFVRRAPAQCIAVSAPSRLYVTNDFIPTHNTTTARILASALNCDKDDPSSRPCGSCATCEAITAGQSADVTEVDAASSGLVEDVRELRRSLQFAPQSRYRVLVLDEAHELSNKGFQTLLKTLEEPPPNTIFILATTELSKVPDTIASRCLSLEFRKLTTAALAKRLRQVADAEGMTEAGTAPDELLAAIAERADGAARDAVSLLDQARMVGVITAVQLATMLGESDHGVRILSALCPDSSATVDYQAAYAAAQEALSAAPRPAAVVASMVAALRRLLSAQGSGQADPVLAALTESIPPQRAVAAMRAVWDYHVKIAPSTDAQAGLDLLIVRLGEALAGAAKPGASARV